jgi:peroxiredoxin
VLDRRYPPGSPGHSIAVPIVFVIDAKGKITHRFSKVPYTTRPEIGLVLKALR